MFKRTQGIWVWGLSKRPESLNQPGIFTTTDGVLSEQPEEITNPTMGDLQLMANAPAMNELLWHTLDDLNHVTFLVPSEKIMGITEIYNNIGKLLATINVAPPEGIPAEIVSEVKQFYTEV